MVKKSKKNKIKKKKTQTKKGIGILPDRRKLMDKAIRGELKKLLKNNVIDKDLYDCIISSGDIFDITVANIEQDMKLKTKDLVKYLLINSECNYIGKTIGVLEDDIRSNSPEFFRCVKKNNLIERVVIQEINKGAFRSIGELFKIILEQPECEDTDI